MGKSFKKSSRFSLETEDWVNGSTSVLHFLFLRDGFPVLLMAFV